MKRIVVLGLVVTLLSACGVRISANPSFKFIANPNELTIGATI